MTSSNRSAGDVSGLAALALAGIAAYAGYRAVDAERRLRDPQASPLIDHLVETAKADIARLRGEFDGFVKSVREEVGAMREAGSRATERDHAAPDQAAPAPEPDIAAA